MKKNILTLSVLVVGLVIGSAVYSAIAADVIFVPAPGAPTACPDTYPGCNPPLNVSKYHQNKFGSLSVNTSTTNPDVYGLDVFGISRFFGNVEVGTALRPASVKIVDGKQAAGRVLVSDAAGLASWADLPNVTSTYEILAGKHTFPSLAADTVNNINVTFTKPFTGIPSVTVQPQFNTFNGGNNGQWWVSNVSTNGFTIHYKTPNSFAYNSDGERAFMWTAVHVK